MNGLQNAQRYDPGSLRVRLLAATLVGLLLALLLAGITLSGLFRSHVQRQFQATLTQQLDQITTQLEFDIEGRPLINSQLLSDPRWQRPYSGLYWQLDEMSAGGQARTGVLRSRSLWDTNLELAADVLADGKVHVHETTGPRQSTLLLLERTVQPTGQSASRWRLIVAGDLQETREAVTRFTRVLALSLAVLLALLALAAWAQVTVGLRPLRLLQHSLQQVQDGRTRRLHGTFPTEVRPLVDDFNSVLDRNDEVVARARTQAGNLAHALKTPLSVLEQLASRRSAGISGETAQQMTEQVTLARRHIDWHLARARVAATHRLPGQRTEVGPVLAGLVRVMERVHADRSLAILVKLPDEPLYFAGEEQDLQEILGNLLDNACKWARSRVEVQFDITAEAPTTTGQARLHVEFQDDGPGISTQHLQTVVTRGVRLDEDVPGSGLGLAIVQDLVTLYGGELALRPAAQGGLAATVYLPASLTRK